MESIFKLVAFMGVVFIHFIPTYIAYKRKKHNRITIAVVNLLSGWIIIGWFFALYMALKNDDNQALYKAKYKL
ncbi:superinfection immunity protein [Halalkalibacter sp. AB-rgal2]|uniref:superinfection immunity protein n=1 Tax=Halalkalibacter sp. AB-rgal2 TaxID=3242695 RepID=UPI00359CE532